MPVYGIEYKGDGEYLWLLSSTSDLMLFFWLLYASVKYLWRNFTRLTAEVTSIFGITFFGVITHTRNYGNCIGVVPFVFPQLFISRDQVSSSQFCRLNFWAQVLDFVSSTVWKYILQPNLQISWSHKENIRHSSGEAQERYTRVECAEPRRGERRWGALSGGLRPLRSASLGPRPGPGLAQRAARCKACLFGGAAETPLDYS